MRDKLISRRSFLSLPVLLPIALRGYSASVGEHVFQYDRVLGTSLDLAVWTSDASAAAGIDAAVADEVGRLTSILNTRDSGSEISRLDDANAPPASQDLLNVLRAYEFWAARTMGVLSLRPGGPASARNVDALGKAYILDKAARAARGAASGVDGIVLNIGGDIVTWGKAVEIAVANPTSPYDNAPPLTRIMVQDCAIATSGSYARGAHLLDGRSGIAAPVGRASTVIAPNAVTANAIATTMCIAGEEAGFSLLNGIRNTEALFLNNSRERRSPRFAAIERPLAKTIAAVVAAGWPAGYAMTISLILTGGGSSRFGGFGRGGKRPYVAVWVENSAGKIVRILAFWAGQQRYFSELSRFWQTTGRNQNLLHSVARATRAPGKYDLVWDGFDDQHNPAPTGNYRVIVETNREHGSYAKQEGTIDCGDSPTTTTLSATANFEAVAVKYGPKPNPA